MNARASAALLVLCVAVGAFAFAGCVGHPIGADLVTPEKAYRQVEKSALNSGALSASTVSILHRYDLDELVADQPDQALRRLHQKALDTNERDLLFALSELSRYTGDQVRRSIKPWEPRDERPYYLGSAIYAYLFLFGEAKGDAPGAFDRRFRTACDLYNYSLGRALAERRGTNAVAHVESGRRRWPGGEIDLRVDASGFPAVTTNVVRYVLADQFLVRGLSTRNRQAGIGTPLVAVGEKDPDLRIRRSTPATVLLRLPGSLPEVSSNGAAGVLELYSAFNESTVKIGTAHVPLEADLTVARAYALNQPIAWQMDSLLFFSPSEAMRSQVILSEPYHPGSVPVVLVHGTFSSPVWWGEMLNTLNADPVLRHRCQIWLFLYGSGKPLVVSANELRDELAATIRKLDPEGKDPALQQMVVIGHSQGGLLAKLAATDTGDKLWRVFSDKSPEELKLTDDQRATIRSLAFFEPLPFVRRVVFISTPHRGSFLAGNFLRSLARKFVTLPSNVAQRTSDLTKPTEGIRLPEIFRDKMPTSLDGMSPKNPVLLTLSEIPVAPGITAHSIIAVKGDGDYHEGNDGVVEYRSAHVPYVESELVVHSGHSCQDKPATIEEVRRILHEHLAGLPDLRPARP